MFARKKAEVDWKAVDGAFTKQRRLHLVKGSDGLDHCPITGCEHPGFASQRGCRKHVKRKHGWYYYFDEKPNVSIDTLVTSPSALNGNDEKGSKTIPSCSTDNDSHVPFRSGFKVAVGEGNLVNNQTYLSREL